MRESRFYHQGFRERPKQPSIATTVGVIVSMLSDIGQQTVDLGKGDSQYKQRLMTGATALSEGQVCLPSVWGTVEDLRHKGRSVRCRQRARQGTAAAAEAGQAR